MHLGKRIKKLRQFKDLTQQQLADKAGLNVQTITSIEKRENKKSTTLGTLGKICTILGVGFKEILADELIIKI